MLHAAHPVHPVHRDRCTSPCTATTRTHATRLSIACCGGGASHYLSLVALVLISANAGLTIAIVTKTVGTHTQKHVYAVSLTSRLNSAGESVVAKVPCVEVAEAIVSIQNGDADQGLVMIPLGNDEFWTPSMSAAHYQVHEDSFGMEQIFLSGDPYDVSYSVSCETSMAACETHPGLLCDVLPSAATASSAEALSFEDAFDGDVRRRLPHGPWPQNPNRNPNVRLKSTG
jgi:hypothetical protein